MIHLGRFGELIPHGLASAEELVVDDFVWHYFKPRLPELVGDYAGLTGLRTFFQKLGGLTNGAFRMKQGQAIPVGDELVVTTGTRMMTLDGQSFEVDVVVVWRVVDGRIAEAWDIPAVHTSRPL